MLTTSHTHTHIHTLMQILTFKCKGNLIILPNTTIQHMNPRWTLFTFCSLIIGSKVHSRRGHEGPQGE